MENRPILDRNINSQTFRSFYYLKDELVRQLNAGRIKKHYRAITNMNDRI